MYFLLQFRYIKICRTKNMVDALKGTFTNYKNENFEEYMSKTGKKMFF